VGVNAADGMFVEGRCLPEQNSILGGKGVIFIFSVYDRRAEEFIKGMSKYYLFYLSDQLQRIDKTHSCKIVFYVV